jgi:tripartite-type tricarboxylate transporter receptor subunit TctC
MLVPVSMVVEVPMVVFTSAKSPAKTLVEFYAMAKASPTPLLYATPGVLSFHHLTLAHMAERMGVAMTHVPTRGMGPILISVANDEVALSITGLGSMQSFLKDGKIRALAWSGRERFAALPDVPTLSEAGLPGFSMTIKAGLFAHKDTPRPLIERIARDLAEAARAPEVTGFIAANGAIPAGTTPEEFACAAEKDIELLGPLARRLAHNK